MNSVLTQRVIGLILMFGLFGCQTLIEKQELSQTFSCYDDYDRIELVLIDEVSGAEKELTPGADGVVSFGELPFGPYAVGIKAWSDELDEPLISLRRKFRVPLDRNAQILSLPSPGEVSNVMGLNDGFKRKVSVEFNFPCASTEWRWYHLSSSPDSIYTATTSIPFEQQLLMLNRPDYESFYLGIESWTETENLSFSTRSKVMRIDPTPENYVMFELNDRLTFDILEAGERFFSIDLPSDQLYRIDFYDSHNGPYTADQIVFFGSGAFGEARAAPPRGYGRLFNAGPGLFDLRAAVAYPGAGGTAAVEVKPAVPDKVHDFSPEMTITLDQLNSLHRIRTELNAGSYVFRLRPEAFNPEMPVYAWLRFEHELVNEGSTYDAFGRIGPEYNEDDREKTRIFSIAEAGTFDIYLLTGYSGAPTQCMISLTDTIMN